MEKVPPSDFDIRRALTPFSSLEVSRLARYVRLAQELRDTGFFQQHEQRFEITFSPEKGMASSMPFGEDEDKITVMAVRLRKLHAEGRPGAASFSQTVALLRSHLTPNGNSSAQWLETVLDHHETQAELASKTAFIGLVVERKGSDGETVSEVISPEDIFWDWLYGVYLHDDEERLQRVEAWQSIGAHKFNFLKTASDLAKVYYSFFGIVRDVLEEPELCPPR